MGGKRCRSRIPIVTDGSLRILNVVVDEESESYIAVEMASHEVAPEGPNLLHDAMLGSRRAVWLEGIPYEKHLSLKMCSYGKHSWIERRDVGHGSRSTGEVAVGSIAVPTGYEGRFSFLSFEEASGRICAFFPDRPSGHNSRSPCEIVILDVL